MAAKRTRQGDRHVAAFVIGALLGGAAGAAWTLFNAPQSGAETRAALARAVATAVHGAGEAVGGVWERIRDTGERAADRAALALDAVGGGPEETVAPAPAGEPIPEPATASSPSSVGGTEPAAIDPATLAPAAGGADGLAAVDSAALDAATDEPAPDSLVRAPGGAAKTTT